MTEVHHERRNGVAVLTLDRPVSNVLAPTLRAELATALDAALSDPGVSSIVLAAAGADFSTGMDIAEYDTPQKEPRVDQLCQKIENARKPVVAALKGAALGGGFELALACHQRVASKGARVGLPEVTLGLVPNGGATQRLPRIVGAQLALEMMSSGQAIDISDPRLSELIDQTVSGDPLETAIAAAASLAQAGRWKRSRDRTGGLRDALGYQNIVATGMAGARVKSLAVSDILRCVEAAQLLPFERGLELEQVCFEDRRVSPDARARRHYQLAARRATIMPERAKGTAREIRNVFIPGSDSFVIELVLACLDKGAAVVLMAEDAEETEALRGRIGSIYDSAATRGVITGAVRDALMQKVTSDGPNEALALADLVLDAGLIDLKYHHAALNPSAIWVSVTSGGPMPMTVPRDIGSRHVELRMYRPAFRSKLVELCVPPGAGADIVVSVADFFSKQDRTAIRCECVDGLVGGNMSAALFAAALALADAGIGPYRVDAAARALGFAKGPFRLMDEEGLTAVAERLERRRVAGGAGDTGLLARLIASGAPGWPAGRGFYIYDDNGAHYDPGLEAGSAKPNDQAWVEPRNALEAALVNEAAKLMASQVVQRVSDIDVVMVKAYGFDAGRGGPLFQADLRGLLMILKDAQQLAGLSASLWQPHESIEDMVKNGVGFFGRQIAPVSG